MPFTLISLLDRVGRDVGRGLLELFYPACCHVCAQPLSVVDGPLCTACRATLCSDLVPTCHVWEGYNKSSVGRPPMQGGRSPDTPLV